MVNKINSNLGKVPAPYADQARRSAWREEMLAQVLEKVREASPLVARASAQGFAGRSLKGSLVDKYI